MSYKPNPKTESSGIIACIPHNTTCPMHCKDCFFQSGRSYLEPLLENLPNMPTVEEVGHRIVRVNDGNDSNFMRDMVISSTKQYKHKFYNTSMPVHINKFDAPVVLTVNPGVLTDEDFFKLTDTNNLMYVRARTNMWNISNVRNIVEYYTDRKIAVILTFMAYHDINDIPEDYRKYYLCRQRTLNVYYAIKTEAFREIMRMYENNIYVYSCGKLEGEKGTSLCRFCGNCLREYFAALERNSK
ncbi:MAG TPA: hypothetical protein PLQ68_07870 [Clostridia bacterium]|nr:hypothetical protein [Clostridia bacterium]